MDLATLNKANELAEEIEKLRRMKEDIEAESFIKKSGHGITSDAIEAGKTAMQSVVDEAIDAAQTKLDAL